MIKATIIVKLRRSVCAGFTLLELLVASSIAALLMVGVLTLVAHLGSEQARLAQQDLGGNSDHLIGLLRRDLGRAVRLQVGISGQSVVLEGYGAIDPATLKPSGRASLVTYRVLKNRKGSWLLREQRSLDDSITQVWTECLSSGVASISLTADVADGALVQSTSSFPNPQPRGSPITESPTQKQIKDLLPDRLQLRIEWTDQAVPPLSQELVLK